MRKYIISILFFFCISCNANSNSINIEINQYLELPTEDINKSIILFDSPEMGNSYINGHVLGLILHNQTDVLVTFNGDLNLKFLMMNDNIWELGFNNFYYPDDSFDLPSRKEFPVGYTVGLSPYIEGLESPTMIRIIVSGTLKSSGNPVAAYTDVTIHP